MIFKYRQWLTLVQALANDDQLRIKLIKFFIVGSTTTLLYFLLVIFGVELLHFAPLVTVFISFTIVFILSFLFNKNWVFKSSDSVNRTLVKYLLVSLGSLMLNLGITFIMVNILHWWYMIPLVITIVVIPIYTFLLNNFWTFGSGSASR